MIKIKNLNKTYPNGVKANIDLSISLVSGEIYGIVGPNGSGKTTLIRQLLKLIKPTSGQILVDEESDYMHNLAYVPQTAAIYPALSVKETIELSLKYCGLSSKEIKIKTTDVLVLTGLSDIANQLGYTLSGGQRKLLSLAIAIAQDRKYMILDEPTSMVDILTKENIWNIIEELKGRGKGILLASHDISEIQKLCNKIVILKKGKCIFNGLPQEIKIDYYQAEIKINVPNFKNYFIEKNIIFEEKNDSYFVNTKTVDEMFFIITDIKSKYEVSYLSFEYPSLYNGVISLVKNN